MHPNPTSPQPPTVLAVTEVVDLLPIGRGLFTTPLPSMPRLTPSVRTAPESDTSLIHRHFGRTEADSWIWSGWRDSNSRPPAPKSDRWAYRGVSGCVGLYRNVAA